MPSGPAPDIRPAVAPRGCTGRHGKRQERAPTPLPSTPPPMRRSRNSRRRAAVLIAVHIAIAAHIIQWRLQGTTISPVEPSEAMYTLQKGELNAGFLFFCAAILATLIFGRFVCGWGCHVVALQDLCAAWMKRLGIRPKPFRSRLLAWVPLFVALYMFVWPSFYRTFLAPSSEFPAISNHLSTTDFWRTFAPWMVAIPFLAICGFGVVYFLGAKGFCTYGCPYGAIFGFADRFAPGKIVADLSKCEGCAHCTATCTSNVRIHEEIQVHRMVVSTGCMKCLDCVTVCPNDALSYGFTMPSLFAPRLPGKKLTRRYDLTWPEEIGLLCVFAATFFAMRGAYGQVPMLMALGIACCATFLAWLAWRLAREREVSLHRFLLKQTGQLRRAGWLAGAGTLALLALVLHTGFVNYHLWMGGRRLDRLMESVPPGLFVGSSEPYGEETRNEARAALGSYRITAGLGQGGWGLVPLPEQYLDQRLAWLELLAGDVATGSARVERMNATSDAEESTNERLEVALALTLVRSGREELAIGLLENVYRRSPEKARIRDLLASRHVEAKRFDEAAAVYRRWLALAPEDAKARAMLASAVLIPAARLAEAATQLEVATKHAPANAEIQNDLSVAYRLTGRLDDAIRAMETAVRLDSKAPDYPLRLLALLEEAGRIAEAAALRARLGLD